MVSSLATQLSKGISLNAPLLADRSRRKRAETYLFTSREADQHDLHSIHLLGVIGLSKLKTLNVIFSKYDDNIFSDAARGLDRTLQSVSQNVELDRTLGSFLRDLGPYLLEAPASKALEWLIRRFRVNEFNLDDVMALFLPYHDSPHFAKMVSIMHVDESRVWSFLASMKANGKSLPRSVLVDEMVKNIDLARFVTELLPEFLTEGRAHRTLIGFTAGVTVEYLTRMKKINEEIVAFILPAATRLFASDSNTDCVLSGYISLATLSRRCRLSPEVLRTMSMEMIKGQRHIKFQQWLPLLIAVFGPQDELDCLPDAFTDLILQLPGIAEALPDCLKWVGSEKLVLPLLSNLIARARESHCFDLLNSILQSSTAPTLIIERHILLCIEAVLHSADKSDPSLLQMLSRAYQRHGTVFSETYARRLSTEEDTEKSQVLDKILRSIALPLSYTTNDGDRWLLSGHSVDVNTRVTAVRELLKASSAGDIKEDIYNALRDRAGDSSTAVIETLYSDVQTVIPILSSLSFIETVSTTLSGPEVSRPLMRLHLAFITGEFCVHNPDLTPAIFEHIYFPHILFTKPRQKTTMLFWKSLRNSKFADYELFKGCVDIIFSHSELEDGSRSFEEMAAMNVAMIAKIAENIVESNSYRRHFDMLLGFLVKHDAHTIDSAYLLLRSLLNRLSGEHQIDAAHSILVAMGLQSLDTLRDIFVNKRNLTDVMSDDSLLKGVVLKPNSPTTLHRLQAAIIVLFPVLQRPVGVKIAWLGDIHSTSRDTRGRRFVELARAVYSLANSSTAVQSLSTSIIRALFLNLREEALLFLAGIWSTGARSDMDTTLRVTALFHGAAFLQAQSTDIEHPQDFQVILPSLLIAMQSTESSIREAALDCIEIVSQNSALSTKLPTVYAMDSVYGSSSDGIQYLEQHDFGRYISSICARRKHIVNDDHYLGVFQQEMLCKAPSDTKKETGYKRRILCYTLSHIIAWPSVSARVSLLATLENVSNTAKLQMLLPLIQQLVCGDATDHQAEDHIVWNKYCQALLEVFDETAAEHLNEMESESWATLIRLLHSMFSDGTPIIIRDTIARQLYTGLFQLLVTEHQLELCVVLIENATIHAVSQPFIKNTLGVLLKNVTLVTSLLLHFQPSETDGTQRPSKRVKTAVQSENSLTEQSLLSMTFLVEVLVAHSPPSSVELLTCAMDVLTRVFHAYSSQSEANYLMQLLMSMIDTLALSLSGNAILSPGSVRMEILVELLRVSDNPQTFNQALLLIASLARLSPEFVMQNVMPVFTFMGSNVFHRDDAYSFRVVQKTVESIVPVMISFLKSKHAVPLELQIASKDFLRVFTDAATHVPRHRRTRFFNHLVEVLGPEEFTAPICLLLVDRCANRVVRQKPGDIAIALSLPLSILQANFKAAPFKIIEQLLRESSRLLLRITAPEASPHDAFLKSQTDAEQTSSATAKRQIQAILIFVDLLLQRTSRKGSTCDEKAVRESVQILLGFSDLDRSSTTLLELPDLPPIALKTLGHLLRVISAVEFVSSVATIIASRNPVIECGAMNLLSSRLPNIGAKARQELSSAITSIIQHACGSLQHYQDLPTLRADLKALSAISQSASNKEAPELTKAIPIILEVANKNKDLTAEVLASLLPLSPVAGPRILPFFRDVVGLCCDVLGSDVDDRLESKPHTRTAGQDNRIEQNAQSILVALMSSLSQFWGAEELARLTTLCLDERPASLSLRKTTAKRIPAKQILPALFHIWSDIPANDTARQRAFFEFLKRVLRGAPREDVHEHLRSIFKLFLEAFDIVGLQRDEDGTENPSSAAFVEVVPKLNEAAFKPLFRRLFDWAFDQTSEASSHRQTMFCRTLTMLIKMLKGLITPYMSIVLVPLTETLESYRENNSRLQSPRLWLAAIELLQVSVELDEGAFWRADKLHTLFPVLIAQISVAPVLSLSSAQDALKTCLGAFVLAAAEHDDNALLKSLHLSLLMQTRTSDDALVRLFALQCAAHVWRGGAGDKFLGFVADAAPFIAECADDEHDNVAKEARALRRAIETRTGGAGSLDTFMQ